VAAEPKKNQPGGPDAERAKMRRTLIVAGGVAVVIILITVIASVSGGSPRKMSDGSDGSADDPDLKEVIPGVKIRDIKEGSGEPCPPGATVEVNYAGWLSDGMEFDSNRNGSPLKRSLSSEPRNGVIQGWQVGIAGMKAGGIRKLVVSADKGYGNDRRGKIPPGSTLIFEVELLSFSVPTTTGLAEGPGKPMSDGSDGSTGDPELKDIGEGLKVRDLKEGSGEPVKPGQTVVVHYTGWTADGNEFDSSKKHNTPFTANLDPKASIGVIPGWQKGIPGMKPGGIRKLVIPAALAYGSRDRPGIPANSTLIFEVELISVKQ
jgi:peptidylprolyl isomerase